MKIDEISVFLKRLQTIRFSITGGLVRKRQSGFAQLVINGQPPIEITLQICPMILLEIVQGSPQFCLEF